MAQGALHGRCAKLRCRDQALLKFRRGWEAKAGAHRLLCAVHAIQPESVILYDTAALHAGQNIVACIRFDRDRDQNPRTCQRQRS